MDVSVDQAGKDGEVAAVVEERVGGEFRGVTDGLEDAFFYEERSGACALRSDDAVREKSMCHIILIIPLLPIRIPTD